ncbi:hypothetical protein Tco_0138953 [Tanacetum coccineum]
MSVEKSEKTDSSQQGLEFLFSPLLEEYYNPTHGYKKLVSLPHATFDNYRCAFISTQSHDYQLDQRSSIRNQVREIQTMPVQQATALPQILNVYVALRTSGGITVPGDNLYAGCQRIKNCTECLSQSRVIVALSCKCAQTEYQLADMFTKALPEDRFKYLVRRIGMRCLTPADLEVLTNETA